MKTRNFLSIAFMIMFAFAMVLFGSWVGRTYSDGTSTILLTFFASFVAATIVWAIWNLDISVRNSRPKVEAENKNVEKRKRERIDSVLRDLSDEDLLRLRRRLLDGTVSDSHLEDALIGEDGELVYEEKRR